MAKKPVVAQLVLSSAWGGLEMSAFKFARHFKEAGFESLAICPPGSAIEKSLREGGISPFPMHERGYLDPAASWRLHRFLAGHQVDAIFSHSLKDLWILRPALWRLSKIKVIGVAHMFLHSVNKKDILHRYLYSRLNRMIALNQAQLHGLQQCLPVSGERYAVIPHGVDLRRFHPRYRSESLRRELLGSHADGKLIGLVGRLDPRKGQRELIGAASLLRDRFPKSVFVFVGTENVGEEGYGEKLKALIRELGIQDRVRLLGFRSDTPEIMASLDLFVLGSYEETFGLVTIEAMASGLPIVGTHSGGTPEIVEDGVCGHLIPPQDEVAMAEALAAYLENPQLAAQHGTKARQRAEELFDQEKLFQRIEELI